MDGRNRAESLPKQRQHVHTRTGTLEIRRIASIFISEKQGYWRVKTPANVRFRSKTFASLIGNLHGGVSRPAALDQREQHRVGWMQADAAVRGRPAEARNVVGALDGEAVIEEDRVRIGASQYVFENRTASSPADGRCRQACHNLRSRSRSTSLARRSVDTDRHAL